MILGNLSTRDVTRTLSISKQWHGAILSSPKLRRILFLSCALEKDHFTFTHPRDSIQHSALVVQPHPVLLKEWDRGYRQCVRIGWIHIDELNTVPPSTLLFQPPLTEIMVLHRLRWVTIRQNEGVTFGTVVETLETMRAIDEEETFKDPAYCLNHFNLPLYGDRCTYFSIEADGALSATSAFAQAAFEARAYEQYLAKLL